MKIHFIFQVMLNQKLLYNLYHFLVSPGKAGASKTYSDLCYMFFHDKLRIIVPKLTIKIPGIRKEWKNVVKFATGDLCYINNNVFQITE